MENIFYNCFVSLWAHPQSYTHRPVATQPAVNRLVKNWKKKFLYCIALRRLFGSALFDEKYQWERERENRKKMRSILMVCHWTTPVVPLRLSASRGWGKTFCWSHESWMSVHQREWMCVWKCLLHAPRYSITENPFPLNQCRKFDGVRYLHSKHHTHSHTYLLYGSVAMLSTLPTSPLRLRLFLSASSIT